MRLLTRNAHFLGLYRAAAAVLRRVAGANPSLNDGVIAGAPAVVLRTVDQAVAEAAPGAQVRVRSARRHAALLAVCAAVEDGKHGCGIMQRVHVIRRSGGGAERHWRQLITNIAVPTQMSAPNVPQSSEHVQRLDRRVRQARLEEAQLVALQHESTAKAVAAAEDVKQYVKKFIAAEVRHHFLEAAKAAAPQFQAARAKARSALSHFTSHADFLEAELERVFGPADLAL